MSDVRIGIVSWNTADLLDRCLAALPAAIAPFSAEITVVDNASSDDCVAVARAHPGVHVEANMENLGYARAMNQALAGTEAPVLIALNPDTEPDVGALAQLVRTLHDNPRVGLVVPRLTNSDGSLQHSVYRFPSLAVAASVCLLPLTLHEGRIGRRFWLEGHAPHDRSVDIDWAIGAVHCIRREALGGELPYSERWFMYVEDLDLCWRMHQRGWRVRLDAEAEVRHVGNASGEQAWGEFRTARWLDATYDWYALERGQVQARAWSAVNSVGMGSKLAFAYAGLLVHAPRRAQRREWAGQLRFWLSLHGRKLIGGPRAPLRMKSG